MLTRAVVILDGTGWWQMCYDESVLNLHRLLPPGSLGESRLGIIAISLLSSSQALLVISLCPPSRSSSYPIPLVPVS
ncbi:hypothetical protein BDN67DRAFT_968062 [Paxillus ammoniavirescens]|nr:hypothetical protein BDN67DRAFT_968062 [Paxillus ammoniavirescens]